MSYQSISTFLRFSSIFRLSLCFSILALFACDDDNQKQGTGLGISKVPTISVSPTNIYLPELMVGEQTSSTLVVSNIGQSDLRIVEISLSNSLLPAEFDLVHDAFPIDIPPNGQKIVQVNYHPIDTLQDSGFIKIVSNSSVNGELRVPIDRLVGAYDIRFDVSTNMNMGLCDAFVEKAIPFSNVGSVPVTIREMKITDNGSGAFSIVGQKKYDLNGQETIIDNLSAIQIATGERLDVIVRFEKELVQIGETFAANLEITTTDASQSSAFTVRLNTVKTGPQVSVDPVAVEFADWEIGQVSTPQLVTLTNQGSEALEITEIGLAINDPALNAQFSFQDLPTLPYQLPAGGMLSFSMTYAPQMPGTHRTAIAMNFGECQGNLSVPVGGRVPVACIGANPSQVDLGRIALGQSSAPGLVEIFNCGDRPIEVTNLSFDPVAENFDYRLTTRELPFTLNPRDFERVEVSYLNRALAQGELLSTNLKVFNSTDDQPELPVPVSVVGGGSPTCDLLILPTQMNFGLVSRGQIRARELQIFNRGTGSCLLRSKTIEPLIAIPLPGFNQVKFRITRDTVRQEVFAAEYMPIEVTYAPDLFMSDSAKLKVTYFDQFSMTEKTTEAILSGIGGESNIEVIPGHVDFGQVTAGDCASMEQRVTVYNTGIVDLCISDIHFEGNCGEFIISNQPMYENGCITVTRNRPADVYLKYQPNNLGADRCELVFESDASDQPALRVPLSGEGVASSHQIDRFVQSSGQTVDVLFIVDNSGSMQEEQNNLRSNFSAFITGATRFQNDYQLGIVTTDMDAQDESGKLQPPRIMRRSPQIEQQFSSAVDVGTNGSGTEKGLAAAKAALSDPLIFDTGVACQNDGQCVMPDKCVEGFCGGFNRGFLREEAALELVFVSDEVDSSEGTMNFYVDFFKNIKGAGNAARFRANAIVGARNGQASSCSGAGGEADAGTQYVELAQRTNGRVFSICETNFGGPLQEIGNRAFGLPVQFFLTRPAQQASIEVQVNNQNRNQGWQYDGMSNSVIFTEQTVPQPNDQIQVEYDVQCFPRSN
jgi:hypothetical protein